MTQDEGGSGGPAMSVSEAQGHAISQGWLETPAFSALYVSAGDDTKAITFTHPEFLARQVGRPVEAPSFLVYVDQDQARSSSDLAFDDGRTTIRTLDRQSVTVHGFSASLLRVSSRSSELTTREIAVLRLGAANEDFAQAALSEGWRPHCFIGVCDGCGAFGGNERCENQLLDADKSIPVRLWAWWWITDHLPGSTAEHDPQNGETIASQASEFPVTLRQLAFLSTNWRSNVAEDARLRGGARLLEVLRPRVSVPIGESVRRSMLYSPRVNRMLR